MNDITKLIAFIEAQIVNVKNKRKSLSNRCVDQDIENAVLKIKDVIVNYKKMLEITEEEFNSLRKICDENTIFNLEGYKEFFSNGTSHLEDYSIQLVNDFCNDVIEQYEEYKKENSVNSVEIEELDKQFNKLTSLHYKLTKTYEFTASDIDFVVNILKENNITEEEIIEYIIFIAGKYMSNVEQYNFEEKDFIKEKISLEEIIELFNSYDYDFKVFNSKQQEKILTKGNLNNIKGILEVLKNENINLNEPFNSKTILTGRTAQLCEIFVHSTPQIIYDVIDIAKNKIKLYDGKNIDFVSLLERPGIFIIKRRYSKNDGNSPIDLPDDAVCGCHEDFINNINLIFEKYKEVYGNDIGFSEFFKKSKHSCVFEVSHKKIMNIINTLELYGFKTKDYLRALSSFNSTAHADVLDVAIELGCYQYIKDNPSRLIKPVDSDIYTKLAIGYMCHLPNELTFHTRKRRDSNEQYIELNDKFMTEFINLNKENLIEFINLEELSFIRFKLDSIYDDQLYLKLFDELESKIVASETTCFDFAIKDLEKEDSILTKLEKYINPKDSRVYEIEGIRISRNKVLRLYHILKLNNYEITPDIMIYVMSRNSYLTQYQFERLASGIMEILTQGEMIV